MAPLNILINGGGIAGTALAALLSRQGQQVTVLERFSSLRTSGLQIDLRGFGIEVIKEMGLDKAFRAAAVTELALKIVDGNGKQWAYFPARNSTGNEDKESEGNDMNGKAKKKELQSFTSEYEIMRGDLCRMFYDAANQTGKKKVDWRFGREVVKLNECQKNGSRVVDVCILDNESGETTQETFDLVVGCDGVGSKTRRLMTSTEKNITLDQDPAFQPYDGDYSAYFTIRESDGKHISTATSIPATETGITKPPPSTATIYMAPAQMIMTRGHPGVLEQVYLSLSSRSPSSPLSQTHQDRDVAGQKAAWAEAYDSSGYWRKNELIEGLERADDFYMEKLGVVRLDRWSSVVHDEREKEKRGRVVLVGDAGYCPSAKTGMGTTSAVVGAWILAGEIGKANLSSTERTAAGREDKLSDALLAYEDSFRPFMDQVQKGLPGTPSIWEKMLETRIGIAAMYMIMMITAWFKVDLFSQLILREDVKDWQLPKY